MFSIAALMYLYLVLFAYVPLTVVSKSHKTYDENGCCLSCGEFFCRSTNQCEKDWDNCRFGEEDAGTCNYYYESSIFPFTYNLSTLALPLSEPYKIGDTNYQDDEVYLIFNFCRQINPELTPSLPSLCKQTIGEAGEVCKQPAMGYLYLQSTKSTYASCTRLSHCIDDGDMVTMGLLDPAKPASGVYIQYKGGNSCPRGVGELEKESCQLKLANDKTEQGFCAHSVRMNIRCHDEISELPTTTKIVNNGDCGYEITFDHTAGCPVQCPRGEDGAVCSSRGICFFAGYNAGKTVDNYFGGLECLCSTGFYGIACEHVGYEVLVVPIEEKRTWFSFFTGGLGTAFLIAFILLGIIFWEQISTLARSLPFPGNVSSGTAAYESIPLSEEELEASKALRGNIDCRGDIFVGDDFGNVGSFSDDEDYKNATNLQNSSSSDPYHSTSSSGDNGEAGSSANDHSSSSTSSKKAGGSSLTLKTGYGSNAGNKASLIGGPSTVNSIDL